MLASDLIEVVCAAHLSFHVESPFLDRGGIMLVGPPGVLKSTFLSVLDKQYHDAVTMSDINARSLIDLRDAISTGGIRTIVLPELAKLYERADQTARNVEGTVRAMVSEGFQAASFEDQRVNRLAARAMVIAALTPKMRETHFTGWEESGFNRRFLWPLIRLADPDVLERAVIAWELVNFQVAHIPRPPMTGERIRNLTTTAERSQIRAWVKYQPGGNHALHLQLMTKILAVLRWWYNESAPQRDPMKTLASFAEALGRTGATVELETVPRSSQRRGAETRTVNREATHAAAQRLARRGALKRKRRNGRKS